MRAGHKARLARLRRPLDGAEHEAVSRRYRPRLR